MTKQTSTALIVKLADATEPGQYVSGTSEGSRYVCVAVGKTLNLAVRISDANSISVRVEPRTGGGVKNLGSYTAALAAIGIPVHDKAAYASAHMSAETQEKALMGIGAFMAGFAYLNGCEHYPLGKLVDLFGKGA